MLVRHKFAVFDPQAVAGTALETSGEIKLKAYLSCTLTVHPGAFAVVPQEAGLSVLTGQVTVVVSLLVSMPGGVWLVMKV
jgi:hypothetical protein